MAIKFNPLTGNFDFTGSGGGGGSSYIDGEVQNFSALPTSTPPDIDAAYLVREAEGTWLLNRKPAGIYIRTDDTGVRADDWTHAGAFPDVFNDANFLLYDNGDSSKNLAFQLSGISTGQTRTLTVPDASGTLALTSDFAAPPAIGNTTPNTIAGTQLALHDGSDTGTFVAASKLTDDRTYDLPDASGTLALLETLPAGGSTNLWIPASAWIPKTTAGCGVDSRETTTHDQCFDELLFDTGSDEFADALVIMPSNYNNGTVTARFYWTAASGSGGVAWGIQGRAFANDDALDTAAGTAQLVTDTLIAADDMHITSATSAVTIGGTPAANTPIQFTIYRDVSDAGDDLGVDARLLGVEILFN
jgi:hypothetical protein